MSYEALYAELDAPCRCVYPDKCSCKTNMEGDTTMMKMTFKFPLPDNRPKEAFEFLTGYGFIEKVDPHLMEITYSLEDETLGKIVRRVDEIVQETRAYDWWPNGLDLFEQAQEQIDAQKIGLLQVNGAQVKALQSLLRRVASKAVKGHVVVGIEDVQIAADMVALLKNFKPIDVEEPVA